MTLPFGPTHSQWTHTQGNFLEDARKSVFAQQEGLRAKVIQRKQFGGHVDFPQRRYSNVDFSTRNFLADVEVFLPATHIFERTHILFYQKRGGTT